MVKNLGEFVGNRNKDWKRRLFIPLKERKDRTSVGNNYSNVSLLDF